MVLHVCSLRGRARTHQDVLPASDRQSVPCAGGREGQDLGESQKLQACPLRRDPVRSLREDDVGDRSLPDALPSCPAPRLPRCGHTGADVLPALRRDDVPQRG